MSVPAACNVFIDTSPEDLKRRGNEAYKSRDWHEASRYYSEALQRCHSGDDLKTTCLSNRAACHAQLKDHAGVVRDATEVLQRQPAHAKSLLRRMIARDALGVASGALEDAAAILTMDPKNAHALQLLARERSRLSARTKIQQDAPKLASHGVNDSGPPTDAILCVVLITNRPLRCLACLRSLARHATGMYLQVHVLWHASEPRSVHSYQLLQSLPDVSLPPNVETSWLEVPRGQAFTTFSRLIGRLSFQRHMLLLSDCALFHTDFDASVALRVLESRRDVFSVRLDINPRIEYFPEEKQCMPAPPLHCFAESGKLLLWTRWYDKARMAYQDAPKETGWNAILDWTATILRIEDVQRFFSALMPPPATFEDMVDRAADWLSRRQRMKQSEIGHRTACFSCPLLVRHACCDLGTEVSYDQCLRSLLFKEAHALGGMDAFARRLRWTASEVKSYFAEVPAGCEQDEGDSAAGDAAIRTYFEPERFANYYFDTTYVSLDPSMSGLPRQLAAPAPLVSWLVPVRNSEAFVFDCLDSIENQSKVGAGVIEIIFVHDASEDDTLAVLRHFAAERPYIRIVENAAQLGVARSLRAGWAHCRGDFVVRLDADDMAESRRLEVQLGYLEQHKSVSVLGSRARGFWTEERYFTVERLLEKTDGSVAVHGWREFHGHQTSRKGEQFTLRRESGGPIVVVDGPAEFVGSHAVRFGETLACMESETWKQALASIQTVHSGLVLQRRDPPEHPKGGAWLHPLLVRALSVFEDAIFGTTACFRRVDFSDGCPFPEEESESHWCWLGLGRKHAANVGDSLVLVRRHAGNRSCLDQRGIHESRCAALSAYLSEEHSIHVDLGDAAALLDFAGPRVAEQGARLLGALAEVEQDLMARYVRPAEPSCQDAFWRDFVSGREEALEQAIGSLRRRFESKAAELAAVITSVPDDSPR